MKKKCILCGASEEDHPYLFMDEPDECPICLASTEFIVEEDNDEEELDEYD